MKGFQQYLAHSDFSKATILSYVRTAERFLATYGSVSRKNLLTYKGALLENSKPKTVNQRIIGLNKYLEYIGKERLKMKTIKVQQRFFLENVISHEDYVFLKNRLRDEGNEDGYFMIWFMAATGARVSELLQIKAEHVFTGHLDLYSKGGKIRRIYIPKNLQSEANLWLQRRGIESGYIFRNKQGERITIRCVDSRLKKYATRYGINPNVMHAHSFRHRFAKNFIERSGDISLLADLMGHEKIETTRIYLRRTATEQRHIVDEVIDW